MKRTILPPHNKLGYATIPKRKPLNPQLANDRKSFIRLKRTKGYKQWRRWAFSVQRKKCYYCDVRINIDWGKRNYAHTEHRKALSNGGTNEFKNFVLSCPPCNRKKGTGKLQRQTWRIKRNRLQQKRKGLLVKEYTEG